MNFTLNVDFKGCLFDDILTFKGIYDIVIDSDMEVVFMIDNIVLKMVNSGFKYKRFVIESGEINELELTLNEAGLSYTIDGLLSDATNSDKSYYIIDIRNPFVGGF